MPRPEPTPPPARGILAMRRIKYRRVSRAIGCSEAYTSRVLNGWTPPSQRFQEQLAALLDLPVAALFGSESEDGGAA